MLYTPQEWKFKAFIMPSGNDAIEGWYKKLPASAKAFIRDKLRYLAITAEWVKGVDYKKIKATREPIFEIRITDKIGKIEYRLLGCFEPERRTFTLLIGATHKMNVYNPSDCFKTAEKRYKALLKNKENVDDCQWL